MALATATAQAQADKFGQPMDRAAPGNADQAEGARLLAEFRRTTGVGGNYALIFDLRVMPRRGSERTVSGTLFGAQGDSGPLSRLNLAGQNWLIESGPEPRAWTADAHGEVSPAAPGQSLGGTGVTVFDLQMPFLYWTDFTYEGQGKVRGRPTHSFILRPPAGYVPPEPGLTGVRVVIDQQFSKMVQAEILGAKGTAEKSITLLDLKQVDDQWLVKSVDIRDLRTRDKTRLTFTAAALGLEWPAGTFSPDKLGTPLPAIPPDKVVRF